MKLVGIECLKCNDHIHPEGVLKFCKCKTNAVDGNQGTMKVLGFIEDWKFVQLNFDGKGNVTVTDYDGPERESY